MSEDKFVQYQQLMTIEMRPYVPGEDLAGVHIPEGETPEEGDMIARDPQDRDAMWLVTQRMAMQYREVSQLGAAQFVPEKRREEF